MSANAEFEEVAAPSLMVVSESSPELEASLPDALCEASVEVAGSLAVFATSLSATAGVSREESADSLVAVPHAVRVTTTLSNNAAVRDENFDRCILAPNPLTAASHSRLSKIRCYVRRDLSIGAWWGHRYPGLTGGKADSFATRSGKGVAILAM